MKGMIIKMKIRFAVLISIFIFFATPILAIQEISVTVDGYRVEFDVHPQLINDRTMVPMRAIFEELGATVYWDDSSKTVTAVKGSTTVSTTIGNDIITVNGRSKAIDTPPLILNDRTMVPVRFVSESLGYNVEWDGTNKKVIITTASGLEVHFIDVGQADSILIKCDGKSVLIDGGNKGDGDDVCTYLAQQEVDYLDYVFCTHGHEDHVGGLPEVVRNIPIGSVYVQDNYDTKIFESFIAESLARGVSVNNPNAGDKITLGNAEFEIMGPISVSYSDYNDTSVVLRMDYGEASFLFTGDSGQIAEREMINAGKNLDADVLKVGHHGSSTSSSAAFLAAVTPEYSVISCGQDNSYGHPHTETMTAFDNIGTNIYRTDLQGHIVAKSNGNSISFTTQKNSDLTVTHSEVVQEPLYIPHNSSFDISQTTGSYIGNKNTKKLHSSYCGSLPEEKNRIYFNSVNEALLQGYDKCSNCNLG